MQWETSPLQYPSNPAQERYMRLKTLFLAEKYRELERELSLIPENRMAANELYARAYSRARLGKLDVARQDLSEAIRKFKSQFAQSQQAGIQDPKDEPFASLWFAARLSVLLGNHQTTLEKLRAAVVEGKYRFGADLALQAAMAFADAARENLTNPKTNAQDYGLIAIQLLEQALDQNLKYAPKTILVIPEFRELFVDLQKNPVLGDKFIDFTKRFGLNRRYCGVWRMDPNSESRLLTELTTQQHKKAAERTTKRRISTDFQFQWLASKLTMPSLPPQVGRVPDSVQKCGGLSHDGARMLRSH